MTRKNISILTMSFLTEIPENIDEEQYILEVSNRIEELVKNSFEDTLILESEKIGFYSDSDNINKCSNCGCWMTDLNKGNAIREVSPGATFEERLLCDLCLPSEHDLVF